MRTKAIFLLLFLLLTTYFGHSQTAVLAGSIDEFSLRDQQLLGKLKNPYSFTVRPVLLHPLDSSVYFSDPLLQQQQRNYDIAHFTPDLRFAFVS